MRNVIIESYLALAKATVVLMLAIAVIALLHIRQVFEALVIPLILLRTVHNAALDRSVKARKRCRTIRPIDVLIGRMKYDLKFSIGQSLAVTTDSRRASAVQQIGRQRHR